MPKNRQQGIELEQNFITVDLISEVLIKDSPSLKSFQLRQNFSRRKLNFWVFFSIYQPFLRSNFICLMPNNHIQLPKFREYWLEKDVTLVGLKWFLNRINSVNKFMRRWYRDHAEPIQWELNSRKFRFIQFESFFKQKCCQNFNFAVILNYSVMIRDQTVHEVETNH